MYLFLCGHLKLELQRPLIVQEKEQLYDLRMSPNAVSVPNDKQSLHYIVRSGLAGGIAGCVVRLRHTVR